jgi:phage terminase large subunit
LGIVRLPNGWTPRDYQRPLWEALEGGQKRAIEIAHRRWGKDDVALHWAAVSAMTRVAPYWHMLPEAAQARKAIWNAVNPHTGKRRIDEAFPQELRASTQENEMFIRFVNGSTWQVVGSDNYNSLVGSSPAGVVFSEYALADPAAWAYLRPILLENGGWAVFITTARGNNHAKALLDAARKTPDWFAEVSTVVDTKAFTEEALKAEQSEYVAQFGVAEGRALFNQEYMCSFDAAVVGAYYVGEMEIAEAEKRVCDVPYDAVCPVDTYWDLGFSDATAIWFVQRVGGSVNILEYQEWTGSGLLDVAKDLKQKQYLYGTHFLPHDAEQTEISNGRTRKETLEQVLGRNIDVAPRLGVDDGINAVRTIFPRFRFDTTKTERGREVLRNYRRKWDDEKKTYLPRPHHDWASHGADALRTLGVTYREQVKAQAAPRRNLKGLV